MNGYLWSVWNALDQWNERIVTHAASELEFVDSNPPSNKETNPKIQSVIRAFNHCLLFAIHEKGIWVRRLKGSVWRAVPFLKGRAPKRIDCDGANLIVVDDQGVIHFKKVLCESYDRTEDISVAPNWRSRWNVVPLLHSLIVMIGPEKIRLQGEWVDARISHRGWYNHFVVDAAGQQHFSHVGVSTLYLLNSNGREVVMHDPWAPTWSRIVVTMPVKNDSFFVAKAIDVSASTLMAVGHWINKVTGSVHLDVITRLVDLDTEGGNPFFRYSYRKEEGNEKAWVLPVDSEWKSHPLSDVCSVTTAITILQTGEGNEARLLRIAGQRELELEGYFEKKLTDREWRYVSDPAVTRGEQIEEPVEYARDLSGNYECKVDGGNLVLDNFSPSRPRSTLKVCLGEKVSLFDLYSRPSFKNFFGITGQRHELVLRNGEEGCLLFGEQLVIPVSLHWSVRGVTLQSTVGSKKIFCFDFSVMI